MFDDSDSDSNYLSRFAYLKNTSELCFAPYISSLDFYPPPKLFYSGSLKSGQLLSFIYP